VAGNAIGKGMWRRGHSFEKAVHLLVEYTVKRLVLIK